MGSFTAKATSKEGGSFEIPKAGARPARLVGLFDLGTHSREFQGKMTENRKLFFVWELTGEFDSEGRPFVVGRDFSWSLHKKSKLRPFVESWSGSSLREDEQFDFGTFLDQPCLITLTQKEIGEGKKVVEVSGIAPPFPGLSVPPASHPITTVCLDDFSSSIDPLDIPGWVPRLFGREIADDIKASHEWQSLPAF
jgi:hypothetical protein